MSKVIIVVVAAFAITMVAFGLSNRASAGNPWPQNDLTEVAHLDPGIPRYADLAYLNVGGRNIIVFGNSFESRPMTIAEFTGGNLALLSTWSGSQGWSRALDVGVLTGTNIVIVGDEHFGAYALDLSQPGSPVERSHISTSRLHNMAVDSRYSYHVSNLSDTLEVIDWLDPDNPVAAPSLTGAGPNLHGVDVKGGRLFASAPSGSWPNTGWVSIWDTSTFAKIGEFVVGANAHSVGVDDTGNYMVVSHEVSDGQPTIWDISDPLSPLQIGSIPDFGEGTGSVHDLVWKGDKLYATWSSSGFHVFDMATPGNPVHLGGFDTTGGAGGSDVASGAWDSVPVSDSEIYVSDMQKGLYVLSLAALPPTPTPTASPTPSATPTGTPTPTPVPTPVGNDKCDWLSWYETEHGSDATTQDQRVKYGC